MTSRSSFVLVAAALLMATGCASPPIAPDESTELLEVDAAEVAASATDLEGSVLWGGVILGLSNLADRTEIEVLSYPLDRVRRPMPSRSAGGRFVIVQPGYVEPLDYAVGRRVSVLGTLDGSVDGQIGEARQRYPRVQAEQLHLWRPGDTGAQPRVNFGIGIGIDL